MNDNTERRWSITTSVKRKTRYLVEKKSPCGNVEGIAPWFLEKTHVYGPKQKKNSAGM